MTIGKLGDLRGIKQDNSTSVKKHVKLTSEKSLKSNVLSKSKKSKKKLTKSVTKSKKNSKKKSTAKSTTKSKVVKYSKSREIDLVKENYYLKKEVNMLYKLDSIGDKAKSLEDFCKQLLNEIIINLKVELGIVMIKNERSGKLEVNTVNDKMLYLFKGLDYKPFLEIGKRCLSSKKLRELTDKDKLYFKKHNFLINEGFALPLILFDKVIGTIIIANKKKGKFSEYDKKIFDAIISQTDTAIDSIKDKEEIKHKNKQLQIIYDLDELGDNAESMQELLDGLLSHIMKVIPSKSGYVLFFNEKKNDLEIRAKHVSGKENLKEIMSLAKKCLKSKKEIFDEKEIFIPLILNNKPVGVFVLKDKLKGNYDELDEELFEAIVCQADSAIEHANTITKLVQKSKELDALYQIDKIRDESNTFSEMIDKILKELVKIIETQIGFIMLYHEDEKKYSIEYTGRGAKSVKNKLFKIGQEAVKNKKIFTKDNVDKKLKSIMAIPLVLEDKIIGVFGVANPLHKGDFDIDDMKLLEAISSQADTAIFEDFEKQKIKGVFKRYVPDAVVEKMLDMGNDFMKGIKQHMTVSFADIRGFTSMSEKLKDPEKLVITINEYLSAMVEAILKEGGTIDKFVGDEVMALFGAPVHYPDHAKVSIKAAIEMQKAMAKLRVKWKKDGRIPCHIGMGINTGDMVSGNIGCEKMTDYTVLGDNVNIGARLCGAATKDQILVSESTYNETKKIFKFKKLDPISVKGKQKMIQVYEVIY